ncbi:MAG: amidase family protein [Myxococcota bacterium]
MQIHALSALELKSHLERGELTSEEVVTALFERIDEVDHTVNAMVHRFRDAALEEARAADAARSAGDDLGPLHGLPISVKESVDTEGIPSSLGMRARLGHTAASDAVTVALARQQGAIVLGKTNVPQTLLSPMETLNHIWGPTSNPWSEAHGPGGSSGGEGAAIATGQSVLGIGTDIGGSIRFPAAFCGIAGIKPTLHRWSNIGANTAILGQEVVRAQVGPMARTTKDVAFFLRALDTPLHSAHDPLVAPAPIGDPSKVDVADLRIGYYDRDTLFTPAASVQRAVREARDALEAAGAKLVPFEPPNAAGVVHLFFAAVSADGGQTLDSALAHEEAIAPLKMSRRMAKLPGRVRRGIMNAARIMGEERVAGLIEQLGEKSVADYFAITGRRSKLQLEERDAWNAAEVDALLCPIHPTPAVPQGMSHDYVLSIAFCARYNLLNLPAGSVPVTRVRAEETAAPAVYDRIDKRTASIVKESSGLPVGVQVVGRPWREDVVLAVMDVIEGACRRGADYPWTPVDPQTRLRD